MTKNSEKETMIHIDHVRYSYAPLGEEGPWALDDISIDVARGEFVCILGHNGSGKSTLAKLLKAQDVPREGEIYIAGMNTRDEDKIWEIRKACGMVFQNPDNQLVATIVEEDVAFGPENLGIPMPMLRQRVEQALEDVMMLDYKKHSPHLLSGGQKQRIAIAGILAMNPDCIILDEPTAMLDPHGRAEIMKTMEKLREKKKTILYITHYMEEAVLADRIIILEKGKVALSGTPREIFSQVKTMKALGLDVPQVTELSDLLRENGLNIRGDVLTVEELVQELCK